MWSLTKERKEELLKQGKSKVSVLVEKVEDSLGERELGLLSYDIFQSRSQSI